MAARIELGDGTQLDAPPRSGGADGQPVIFGTRPEHLTLVDAGGIPAHVVVMEPTGMDTFIACRHEGVDLSAVFRERHDFAPGSTIHLLPDLQARTCSMRAPASASRPDCARCLFPTSIHD
ncbi:TOBE domain-containing protein [Polaromonas sp. P1(28)-8]|nr:TOBE domain-containing protein [Polaromonas sp. P1(28)-8]